jgi:hypothetical protein
LKTVSGQVVHVPHTRAAFRTARHGSEGGLKGLEVTSREIVFRRVDHDDRGVGAYEESKPRAIRVFDR